MGRAKLAMEYIKKDKARNTTFEKRKKGLMKKAQELATLCDVPLCMIIYKGPTSEPDTFPANRENVRFIIDRYASVPREENAKRCLNLQGVLDSKNKKKTKTAGSCVADKLRVEGDRYGLPDLDGFSREQLSELAYVLGKKMRAVEERIEGMRAGFGNYGGSGNAIFSGNGGGGLQWAMGGAGAGSSSGGSVPPGANYYDPSGVMGGGNFYGPRGVFGGGNGAGFGGAGGSVMAQPVAVFDGRRRFEGHQMGGQKWYEEGRFFC